MLKAEIAVGQFAYLFSFPEFTCHNDVLKLVREKLTSGDPAKRTFVTDQGDLTEINCGEKYDHIRVFDDSVERQVVIPEIEAPAPAKKDQEYGPFPFRGKALFLGCMMEISGAAYRSEFGVLLLPLWAKRNDDEEEIRYEDLVSERNRVKVAAEWAVQNGYQDGEFMIINPPAIIPNGPAAYEYLEDLVAERREELKHGPVKEKTAKAFERG